MGKTDFWIIKLSPESSPTTAPFSYPLTLFPNPANQSISLNTPHSSTLNITITDRLGRVLRRQTIADGDKVDIAALPNGLYLVTATSASGRVYSGKFLKQE